jgi:uncharacterized membrane protein
MQKLLACFRLKLVLVWLVLSPTVAFAYVGPGAGITMLGSLWGLILAIVFVLFGLLILPYKIMRNRMKKNSADAEIDHKDNDQQNEVAAQTELHSEPD